MLTIIYCTPIHTAEAKGFANRLRISGAKAMIRDGSRYSEVEQCDKVVIFPLCDEAIAANYEQQGIRAEVVPVQDHVETEFDESEKETESKPEGVETNDQAIVESTNEATSEVTDGQEGDAVEIETNTPIAKKSRK